MEGGATFGYWATGNCVIARPPSTMMRMETTHAKTGRLIKNCAMMLPQLDFDSMANPAAGDAVNGTGLTTEPGGAFCDPSTTMRSPAFNPLATITLVPT